MRHKPKRLKYPCGLPQLTQREYCRVEYFGCFLAFIIKDFFAIILPQLQLLAPVSAVFPSMENQILLITNMLHRRF